MKYILPAIICCLCIAPATAQYFASLSYSAAMPQGEMADNIRLLHSAKLSVMRQLPGTFSRISGGVDIGVGTYAQITKQQTFVFDDGSTTRTNVRYGSNVFQAGATAKIDLLQKGFFIPYIKGNAGVAKFYSNVTVEDPKDPDGCHPLEKGSLVKDNVFALGYGAGFQVDMGIFCKGMNKRMEWLDFSVNRITGGDVDYINTKRLKDHYHSDPNAPTDPKGGQPVVQRFINVSTNSIHEHQVAELYTSPLRLLEFRLGYTVKF